MTSAKMAELRSRRPATNARAARQQEEQDRSKSKRSSSDTPDLELNIYAILTLIALLGLAFSTFFYYEKAPSLEKFLLQPHKASRPLFGVAAQETNGAGNLKLTEQELKAYDGTDPDKPIYLGINGTIFDVSSSPAFYGPGGHYHHFVGKDATRAWITECWDEDEQFTWRMDDVHVMFLPKYMDEVMSAVANGEDVDDLDVGAYPMDMLKEMAKKTMEKFGSVTDKVKKERRVKDRAEAEAKVQETLAHWVSFFAGNAKYKVAGEVVRDESRPSPPKPCAEAMKKRPLKGGKLDGIMGGAMGGIMGGGAKPAAGAGKPGAGAGKKGEMPAHIKEKIMKEMRDKKGGGAAKEEDDEDLVHDEL